MFCSNCGYNNQSDSNFCAECGSNLIQNAVSTSNQYASPPPLNSQTNSADDLLNTFVGDKYYGYYREKWFKGRTPSLDKKKGFEIYSFNLAGFFLGFVWLCYRKMYGMAFLLAALLPAFDITMMHVKGFEGYSSFDNLLYGLLWLFLTGFLGNYFYLTHSIKKINKIKILSSDPNIIKQQLSAQGGTSLAGGLGIGFLITLMIILIYVLFAPEWF